MAGTSKSYWRKKTHSAPSTVTKTNSYGKDETYKQWDLYHYNPGEYPVVNEDNGHCDSRASSDAEFYAQAAADGNQPGGGKEWDDLNRTIETGINSYGKSENYHQWNGNSGFQVNHPNISISDKF